MKKYKPSILYSCIELTNCGLNISGHCWQNHSLFRLNNRFINYQFIRKNCCKILHAHLQQYYYKFHEADFAHSIYSPQEHLERRRNAAGADILLRRRPPWTRAAVEVWAGTFETFSQRSAAAARCPYGLRERRMLQCAALSLAHSAAASRVKAAQPRPLMGMPTDQQLTPFSACLWWKPTNRLPLLPNGLTDWHCV